MMSLLRTLKFVIGHPFNRGRRLTGLGRYVRWQLHCRLFPDCPLAVPWVDGVQLLVHRGETGVTGNLYCGLHEFEDMAFALHLLRPDDCFMDIGANSGVYTLLACGAAGARGIAVEPIPDTFHRLQDHVALNRLSPRVTCLNLGLGSERATLTFTAACDTTNHALAPGEQSDGPTVQVPVETLDDVCLQQGAQPALIKLDVEGFELPVLRGGARTLASPTLRAAIVELNGSGAAYGIPDVEVVRKLQDAGFTPVAYDPVRRELTPRTLPSLCTGNVIFVRGLDAAAERCRSASRHRILGQEL